jgi:hypothetical protein
MPLASGDFVTRLSGGAANSVGNASLGGAKSSTVAPSTIDGLFDQTSATEATAGDVEYRCIYLHNNYSADMQVTVVWISANTPNAATTMAIGLGTSAINGTEQTIANESTAPVGVTFSEPATQGAGLSIGTIPAGQHKAFWLRRTITAGATAIANDTATFSYYAEAV